MADEVLHRIEIQDSKPIIDNDVELGKREEEPVAKKELDASSSGYLRYFLKVFGVLGLNFLLSMLAVYIMVTARLFFEKRPINIWVVIVAIVLAVFSYTFLFYTLEATKKMVLIPLLLALYSYIASMSVLVSYMASQFVLSTAIIMYSMVAVTIGIFSLLLYTFSAKFCMKQGSKRWATIALCIGTLVPLIYLAIVIFGAKRPIALPKPILDEVIRNLKYSVADGAGKVQEKFSTWKRLVLFIISSVLSGGFMIFLVIYSMGFVRKEDESSEASSMRAVFNIYIYLTFPAVAIMKLFNWMVKKAASIAKKTAQEADKKDGLEENVVSSD